MLKNPIGRLLAILDNTHGVYAYVHECVTVQLSVLDAVTYTTLVVFSAPVALVVKCVYCEQPHITVLNIVHSLHT